ncbi:MAG: helix-turn-helix transcriptional regulator [Thermoplasmata archaeon]|nr:helix-turn-helix transcriptional regulator [Thermoplasmata archaeon]
MEPHKLPAVMWKTCPIHSSLGVLGRAWTLLVLRDVSFFRKVRFSDILHNNPGLSARLLSIRLKQLQKEGLIDRAVNPEDHREVWYNITQKGLDVVPILAAFIQFGARHRAKEVFPDKVPRDFRTLFPRDQEYMLGDFYNYARADGRAGAKARSG